MKIVHLLFCLFFTPSSLQGVLWTKESFRTVCAIAQTPNNLLEITVNKKTGEFEFQCNKHLNHIPNTQNITCTIGFQKFGEKAKSKIFDTRIGLSNFSFVGKNKGNYTVVFNEGDCRVFYVFNYKGETPKIKEITDCKN